MVQKILRSGDPRLRQKCKSVAKIDIKILGLIKDLKDTLVIQKDPEGVGLAAPQIGKNVRVFVINYKGFKRVVINPEIISKTPKPQETKTPSKEKSTSEILEGCLSLPNYYCPLKRNQKVKIKYQNEKGEEKTETFTGFHTQIVLHEIDHLNGILFLDRLLEQKKPLYKLEKGEWEEVEI